MRATIGDLASPSFAFWYTTIQHRASLIHIAETWLHNHGARPRFTNSSESGVRSGSLVQVVFPRWLYLIVSQRGFLPGVRGIHASLNLCPSYASMTRPCAGEPAERTPVRSCA